MSDRVTVYDEQGIKLVLGPNDHLATGGEGAVYARKDSVYKVYLDPAKARRARLAEKVALLKQLTHPGIAAPNGALLDKDGQFVGLTLPRVPGEALCKLFTNSWRDANQFGEAQTLAVTQRMHDIVRYAHSQQALLVDGNELNWLVEGSRPTVIDVDSWQLPGFAATAIMPSIRDPLASQGFTAGSDWYAWAIVTFQLWTGLHPFKGTHPAFARNAMEARMQAQVSIFDPQVRVPPAARPVDGIPAGLRQWYRDVFQSAHRAPPPSNFAGGPAAQTAPRLRVRQALNASVKQERLGHAGEKVLAAFNGFALARSSSGLLVWDALRKAPLDWIDNPTCQAVLGRKAAILRLAQAEVLVRLEEGVGLQAQLRNEPAGPVLPTRAHGLWQSGNRLFALVEGVANGLVEVNVAMLGGRALVSVDKQWPVSTLATEFYRGCFVQDCLGAPFVGVLEGSGVVQAKAPALRGYRVIDVMVEGISMAVTQRSEFSSVVRREGLNGLIEAMRAKLPPSSSS